MDLHQKKVTRKYIISGRVQYVGFRYFLLLSARDMGILGYAKNLSNGDVEVVAHGRKDIIDTFKLLCQKGPSGALVENVVDVEYTAQCDFADFTIL